MCHATPARRARRAAPRRAGADALRGVDGSCRGMFRLVAGLDKEPPPPPRTKWTRRVPHPVLIGHAASLTPY